MMDRIMLFGGIALVLYLAHCWLRPWRDCWMCKGKPRNYGDGSTAFSIFCWWCDSTGRRRRWGSRLLGRGLGQL